MRLLIAYFFIFSVGLTKAQDTVRYVGTEKVNIDYHHGQLRPVIGVHNVQVFRANRNPAAAAAGINWTYNHAPMLCYWNKKFYLQYLANPVGEHVPPGRSMMQTSEDGMHWSDPLVSFPIYRIPDGIQKKGRPEIAKDLDAVMHQRMGFFVSSSNRLLTLAFYGIVMGKGDDPNDGKGIGRVVREIYKDGKLGPVYFIRYNSSWDTSKSAFPFYASSKDKGFVAACNELLGNPLMMQQWVEEADRNDALIPLKKDVKAFSYYHLNNGEVVGLWKHALTSISKDNGLSWQYGPLRAPGFVNSNAKIWGQKTTDGKFATVYNPSEFRWPLALSLSNNGLVYDRLLLVNGTISGMRYGGAYKSYGPQYVRGIEEGNGQPKDGKMWVTYSMNKEDIWVSKIPVPVKDVCTGPIKDSFDTRPLGKELDEWNFNSGQWTPVAVGTYKGLRTLQMRDKDPFDEAYAERVIAAATKSTVAFTIVPEQSSHGQLDIEFADGKGSPAIRLTLDSLGNLITKAGYRNKQLAQYQAGQPIHISVEFDASNRFYTTSVNGKKLSPNLMFAPVSNIERIIFRTGSVRRFPNADTPTDQDYDLPGADLSCREAVFHLLSFKSGAN
jgi:hypothetical protein